MFVNNFLGGVSRGIPENTDPTALAANGMSGGRGMRFESDLKRPYFDDDGRPAVTINTGRWTVEKGMRVPIREEVTLNELHSRTGIMSPVWNATTLRKEEWLELDRTVLRAARYRLRAWADISRAASFGGFNGMSKMILEHETMSDPGEAQVDMDGLTEGIRNDAPKFQLEGLPLPITHCDFWFDSRRLAVSRNTGTPLDTTMGEASGRRVAESIEKQTTGNNTGVVYGGNSTQVGGYGRTSQVYGLTNFPARLVKTNLYNPGVASWTPSKTVLDVLAMRDQLTARKFYGPFMIYHSNDWDQYMDQDYIITGGATVATQTLRQRILAIGKENGGDDFQAQISGVKRLDFLFGTVPDTNTASATYRGPGAEGIAAAGNPFTLLMVQMTPDVVRAVNGMDITTLQWESIGGMRVNFKVMAIQVPQLRADFYGNCGILHATLS